MEKGKRKRNTDDDEKEIINDDPEENVDQDDDEDLHHRSPSSAPQWVKELVREYNGSELRFVATKKMASSDLDGNQNRFRIPRKNVDTTLRPLLSHSEREEANLLQPIKKGSAAKLMMTTTSGEAGTSKRRGGRRHGGLEVTVFSPPPCPRFCVRLTCWDSTGDTILKGQEWQHFTILSGIQVDDAVDIWCFREGPERKLCFIITRTA